MLVAARIVDGVLRVDLRPWSVRRSERIVECALTKSLSVEEVSGHQSVQRFFIAMLYEAERRGRRSVRAIRKIFARGRFLRFRFSVF